MELPKSLIIADHTWLRAMRLAAFVMGAVFLIFALIQSIWSPFEHASDKFLAATGIVLVFIGVSRKEPEPKEETDA
jgi:small neutral amino acid transporter SnatA (MarC family)